MLQVIYPSVLLNVHTSPNLRNKKHPTLAYLLKDEEVSS